jgi:hypothetical protein
MLQYLAQGGCQALEDAVRRRADDFDDIDWLSTANTSSRSPEATAGIPRARRAPSNPIASEEDCERRR